VSHCERVALRLWRRDARRAGRWTLGLSEPLRERCPLTEGLTEQREARWDRASLLATCASLGIAARHTRGIGSAGMF
jgi:hypothetical protein